MRKGISTVDEFHLAGYVGLTSVAALSSSERLVIKPTRSAIGSGTVTLIYTLFDVQGGGVLPYMGYIGICCSEGYGFQAVYSRKSESL